MGAPCLAEGAQRAADRVAVHLVVIEAPLPPELADGAAVASIRAAAIAAVAVLGGPFGRGEQRWQP